MFSIRKRHKIQYFYNKLGGSEGIAIDTKKVDSLRNKEYIVKTVIAIKGTIDTICSLESNEEVQKQIDTYFPKHKHIGRIANAFLSAHPHVFGDLIRVIHKHRINNDLRGWHIPNEYLDDLQQIFLFRNRTENIGKNIPGIIEYILKNQGFIQFCVGQQSLLDIGSHDFSLMSENKRKSAIKKLITTGLISNIEGCTRDTVDTYFLQTKTRILHFLHDIYGTNVSDLEWCQNIEDLTKELSKLFETGKGNDRKRAWKVIQAFHAWGDVLDIESRYAQTKNSLKKIPKRLNDVGIRVEPKSIIMKIERGVEVYSGIWEHKGYKIIVSWRAKTPKSMLKKLWATEEYIRSSAVRDEFGLSSAYPDSIPANIKKEIMLLSNNLMPDNGYILKNKGELDDKNLYRAFLSEAKKKPLFESSKAGLDPKIRNASQSGFTKVGGQSMGCEIQHSTISAMEWKKKEDPVYKLKDAMDAIMRGANQASPKEAFDAIIREIPTPKDIQELKEAIIFIKDEVYLEDGKCESYSDILLYLLNKGNHLYVFTAPLADTKSDDIAFFTTQNHVGVFTEKWSSSFERCNPKNTPIQWSKMTQYVKSLQQTH